MMGTRLKPGEVWNLAGLWDGWTIGRDGLLYAPGWRRGLEPGEILALPYVRALAAAEARQAAELRRTVAELERETAAALESARRYRRMVQLEARLGLMLERVS
jgi:hypothetical protein